MANIFARLFGGTPAVLAAPAEPELGIGGVTAPAGPANQTGFPGSTSQVRTYPGLNPRVAKVRSDTNTGANNSTGTTPETRQQSYRGDERGARTRSPRNTPRVPGQQSVIRQEMQHNSGAEFFGGPMLQTGPGNNTAGAHPLTPAQHAGGHSMLDTTTPYSKAPFQYPTDTPGAQNVRNKTAQKYLNKPGDVHEYKSAPRADQARNYGQQTDGNVHPDAVTQDVSVPNRFVYPNQGWEVMREMPYAGRGNGARGAALNGQRFYSTGQETQFWNAGQGGVGTGRLRGSGNSRPVSFDQPAPWTANFYDTTDEIGTADNPNTTPGQQPSAIYTSPPGGRSGNRTQRG